MTDQELVASLLSQVGKQIEAVFIGIGDGDWDRRSCASAMSPRETLIHITECLVALESSRQGQDYAWGSYQDDRDPADLMATYRTKRASTAETVADSNEEHLMAVMNYVVLHESYHLGQMATLRLEIGDWNPYSIYE